MIRVEDRDDLIAKLAADNIGTGIHYPIPLHLQKAYGHLGYKEGDFPVSERLAKEIVSLPMYPTLTEEQQQRVCEAVRQIFRETGFPARVRPTCSGCIRNSRSPALSNLLRSIVDQAAVGHS